MCKKLEENRGSVIIEMCIIMPIVVAIIISLVFLFLDCLNSGAIQGNAYSELYSYNNDNQGEYILTDDEGNISVNSEAINALFETGIYSYIGEVVYYSTEFDICTRRLRRWQLYGNVFWE